MLLCLEGIAYSESFVDGNHLRIDMKHSQVRTNTYNVTAILVAETEIEGIKNSPQQNHSGRRGGLIQNQVRI